MERYFIFLLLCLIATLQAASAEKFHDCDNPPEVPNADFNIDENGDFVKAVYACKSGYELQGPLEIECDLDTDEWNTDPPICVQIEETEQQNTEQQQKKRGKIVENTKVSLDLAASLDMSCATAQIEAPVVENGVLQSYERHSRDNFVFLAAIYACLDNYELEDPENNVLYCSQERWIGNTPECVGRNEDYEYTEEDEEETETEGETESESEDPNKMVENINVETGPDGKTTVVVNSQPATKETEEETPTEDDIYADENEDGNAIPGSTTQDPYDPQVLDDNCGEHKTDCSQICRRVQYPDVNDIHYKCDCYEGFTLDPYDYRTCHDIDECELNNGNCSQICHNTPGSFNCGCEQGLQIDTNDLKSCIDINECERPEILEQCEGACENTLGSYKCLPILNVPEQAQPAELVCEAGFQPSVDGAYCVDIDECASQTHECSYECINTNGAYQCVCPPNRHLLDDAHSCAIDTCEDLAKYNKPACSHACETLPNEGGYVCKCPDNYELSEDSHNCVAVQNTCDNEEQNCSPGQCLASDSFELGFTCQCPAGYALSADGYSCLDIDECLLGTHNCEQSCENTEGGYICSCRPGFTLDELQKCQDIDECAAGLHECADLQCVNEVGYYNCLCSDGKPPNPQTNQCDVVTPAADACAVNNCQHICLEDGNCACRTGYSLAEDGNSCFDVNECLVNNGGCEQLCTNFNGSYTCACQSGYQLGEDAHTCLDIDECASGTHLCSHECVNTLGGYLCQCPEGYELDADKQRCLDLNECAAGVALCSHECVNTEGGYVCSCPLGYELTENGQTCEQVLDACEVNNGGCSHSCSTIEGCLCPKGYVLGEDQKTCVDVDECAEGNGDCAHICVNKQGGFECACEVGFEQDSLNAFNCVDIDECKNTTVCQYACVNTLGSYRCSCPKGYEADGNHCRDVNECLTDNGGCIGGICINHNGSHECRCPRGLQLAADLRTCRARTKPRDPCPVFKAPPHSVHKCETSRNKDNSYSVYCNVGCQPGYRLVGPARRVCNASGRWDPYENQCLPVVCPGLLAPLNGHIVPAKCTLNQVLMDTKCHLRCAQGYAPQGNSLAVCNSNGTWTQNSVLVCRPLNNNHFNPDLNRIPPPVVVTHNKQIPPPVFPVTNQAIVPTYATHAVGQIGKIPFCPTSINVTLLKHQARRSVYWKEPDFGPGSKIVFRSHFRGQLFSLGEHRVYYEAMDQHGSILRCVFNIIVKGPVPESRNTYPSMHLSMSNVIPGKVKPVVPSHKGLIQAKALPGHDTYIICPNKKPEKVNTAVFFFPSHCYFKNVRINARRHFNIQRSLFKSEWQPFFNF